MISLFIIKHEIQLEKIIPARAAAVREGILVFLTIDMEAVSNDGGAGSKGRNWSVFVLGVGMYDWLKKV